MSEMVDRVAEAIALAGNGGTWDDWYNPEQKEFHRQRARAAIAAMREPTEEMTCDQDAQAIWQDMIDEALK